MRNIDLSAISAYELIRREELTDIKSTGLIFRHKKTGARMCVISNDDPNKTFCAAFRTPPENSTGVPHIIEHTVLCGSKDFPARDPFMQLAKGSLNTFLNAMTYPDKTLYPVASYNDKDFQNLMHVYLDAVFYPNLHKRKEIFMQEGWHYHIEKPEDPIELNGVVYSEMKGSMSSPDTVLFEEIVANLYPDSTYGVNSGGDPDVIPSLTYEYYTDFHKKYYHPSNSYIFLYGDMDVAEKLNWIDEKYLSHFDKLEIDSSIKTTPSFNGMHEVTRFYSVPENEDTEGKTYLSFSCSCGSMLNTEEATAWRVLSDVLLDMPGAPLKQALLDAEIGQDIYGGYEDHMLTPMFVVVAKNAKKEDAEKFRNIIFDTLKKVVKDGVNEKALLGILNNAEYRWRESDYGGTSKGIYHVIDMLQTWLYDDTKVFDVLYRNKIYADLKSKIGTDYYAKLIEKYILNTNHSLLLMLEPKKGLVEKKENELKKKLEDYKASLSADEINALVEATNKLIEYQTEDATEEELNCIPSIKRTDIKREAEPFSNVEFEIDGTKSIRHKYETNGITYVKLLFPLGDIPTEKLPYVSSLGGILGQIDTANHTYADLASEIKIHTGEISFGINNYKMYGKSDEAKLVFVANIKAFASEIPYAFDLASEIITSSKFSDTKRLREILGESVSDKQRQIIGGGNSIGISRIKSYYSQRGVNDEYLGGLENYFVKKDIFNNYEQKKDAYAKDLEDAAHFVFDTKNMIISIAASDEDIENCEKPIVKFKSELNKMPKKVYTDCKQIKPEIKNEGFMTSGMVQYLEAGGNLFDKGYKYHGAYAVMRTAVNCDYLYNMIRLKGGAYGCGLGIQSDTGDVFFYSYRDPKLPETMDVYKKTPDFIENLSPDESELTKYIIGTFSSIDTPKSISGKIGSSVQAYMTDVKLEEVQRIRNEMLDVTLDEIHESAKVIKDVLSQNITCAVGSATKLKENSSMFKSVSELN